MAEPNKTEATANPNSPELSPKPYSTVFIESIVPLITAVSNPNKNPPNAAIIEIYITDFNCAVDFILFPSSLFT